MLMVGSIVFRETFEAGLVVCIMLALTRGFSRRSAWIALGLAAGVAGSVLVALATTLLSPAGQGESKDLFNAAVLALAVCMLVWHGIWGAAYSREVLATGTLVSRSVLPGGRSMAVLALVVSAAVLREGSEVVLFLYGMATSMESDRLPSLRDGVVLGLLLGALASAAVYAGLTAISSRRLFTVTGWFIAFLAAGMAAQSVALLERANAAPWAVSYAWDLRDTLPISRFPGYVLRILLGYTDHASQMQVVAYLIVLATMLVISGAKLELVPRPTLLALARWLLPSGGDAPVARVPSGNVRPVAHSQAPESGLVTLGPRGRAARSRPRVRFGDFEHFRTGVEQFLDQARYDATFGPLVGIDPAAWDCIVPFRFNENGLLADHPGVQGRKAWLPSDEAVALCDDKNALNGFMLENGFAHLIPAILDKENLVFPFILKKKTDEHGANAFIIGDRAEARMFEDRIASPDYFCQAYVKGRREYAQHVLFVNGEVKYHQLVEYRMASDIYVRGKGATAKRSTLLHSSPFLDDFVPLLAAIGYEGLCCINYKMDGGRPMLLEINPRFGYSLCFDINRFLAAYVASLSSEGAARDVLRTKMAVLRNVSFGA